MLSLKETIEKNLIYDISSQDKVKDRFDKVAKPLDSLGKFEKLISKIGGIRASADVSINNPVLCVFAADNGIVEEKVSQSDHSVTTECVKNIADYKSVAGVFAKKADAKIKVYDMGIIDDIDHDKYHITNKKIRNGTSNFLKTSAMTREEVIKAIEIGIDAAFSLKEEKADLICIGEMGIGNTTTSSAVIAGLLKMPARDVTGYGAGLSDEGYKRKIEVIDKGIIKYDLYNKDPLTILQNVGGFDIAAMCGMVIGCAVNNIPVILDGLISLTAAYLAKLITGKNIEDFVIASHVGKEKAVKILLERLKLDAVIDADMALGEGTGALLMLILLKTNILVLDDTIRFEDTDIEQYVRLHEES